MASSYAGSLTKVPRVSLGEGALDAIDLGLGGVGLPKDEAKGLHIKLYAQG